MTTDLGEHKGLPIKREGALIRKGARVVRDTAEIASMDVGDGDYGYLSLEYRQAGERFEAIMSEDDPDVVLGYERVLVLDAIGAAPDERVGTPKAIAETKAKVAELQEKRAKEKKGTMRVTGDEAEPQRSDLPEPNVGARAEDDDFFDPEAEGASESNGVASEEREPVSV